MAETQAGSLVWRGIAIQLAVGAALGFVATCFFGPGLLGWWYEPPVKEIPSCASSVRSAITQFVVMQLISAAIGGILALIVVMLVRRRFGKRASASASADQAEVPGSGR